MENKTHFTKTGVDGKIILEQRVARIAKFRNWLDYEILEIIDAYDALQEAQ